MTRSAGKRRSLTVRAFEYSYRRDKAKLYDQRGPWWAGFCSGSYDGYLAGYRAGKREGKKSGAEPTPGR